MAARQVDCDWMLRRRCLDTQTLFSLLARASAGTRSVRAAVEQKCRQDAPGDVRVSASAVSRALRRLPVGSFDRVQRHLLSRFSHAAGRRVLAVDGSKVRVAPSLMQEGFRTQRKCVDERGKHHPLALLTCVLDVHTRLPVAYSVRSSFDERAAIIELLPQLRQGDVLVCDRGYFSHTLVACARSCGIHVLLRLRRNADKRVQQWIEAGAAVGPHPRLHGKLFKYTAQGSPFYCFTTCVDVPLTTLQDWYRLRWTVECYFKVMKTDLCLRGIRCRTSKLPLHCTRPGRQVPDQQVLLPVRIADGNGR